MKWRKVEKYAGSGDSFLDTVGWQEEGVVEVTGTGQGWEISND